MAYTHEYFNTKNVLFSYLYFGAQKEACAVLVLTQWLVVADHEYLIFTPKSVSDSTRVLNSASDITAVKRKCEKNSTATEM